MRFGEFLVNSSRLSEAALEEALQVQRYRPERLGRILLNLGHISAQALNEALVVFLKPSSVQITAPLMTSIANSKEAVGHHPEIQSWCSERRIAPLELAAKTLRVASREFRDDWIDECAKFFALDLEISLCDADTFQTLEDATLNGTGRGTSDVQITTTVSADQKIRTSDPYTSVFRDALQAARNRRVSDVHIQPTSDGIAIRMRVHGDMVLWKSLGKEHQQGLTSEIKRITGLPLATSGEAKDARVTFSEWKLDLRANLVPTHLGEKIVLRLLDRAKSFALSEIGLPRKSEMDLRKVLTSENGVVIISGPTGSGKTNTLFALLSEIDRKTNNVVTLEDPVEYVMDGLTQIQITAKLSFADALRAVMRQDPDVILVGEIRDEETAQLCIKAASTGHLVLSTLHANSAADVVERLLGLGVERHLALSVLRMVAAQRLLPKLCDACALHAPSHEVERLISLSDEQRATAKFRRRNTAGCSSCDLGRVGRVPILEYLKAPAIQGLFANGTEASGHSATLKQEALDLAVKGEVDVEDVLSIA